jgi:hypothetical protein
MRTSRASLLSALRTTVAVVAVAASAVLLTTHPVEAAPATDHPAPPAHRKVPTTPLDLRDIPTGTPPAIGWGETGPRRTLLHAPDGTTARAPRRVVNAVPLGDGWVVQVGGRGWPSVRQLRADGSVRREWQRTGYGLAVSPEGGAVAFTIKGGKVRVLDRGGRRVTRMPAVPARWTSPAVVTGDDCRESETSTGCAVLVGNERGTMSWATSSHGIVDTLPFRSVTTGRGPWVGGYTSFSDEGSCSVMRRGLRVRWTTCRNSLSAISPDERHVLGLPAYLDGLGPGRLDLLDLRTGQRVRSWTSSRRDSVVYFDEVWEDADHVLVVTFDGDETWSVVRLGLDGSLEYAVPPRRSGEFGPLHLQER